MMRGRLKTKLYIYNITTERAFSNNNTFANAHVRRVTRVELLTISYHLKIFKKKKKKNIYISMYRR